MSELSIIEITPDMAPRIYVEKGLEKFLEQIREGVNEVPDISTDKGRKRIASLAAKVSRSKTAVEKPGRDYPERTAESMGISVLDAEQWRKLELMRDSAMAHPAARWMLEAPGYCEASMYWNDEETGELCRIRPDKWLNEHNVIVDVKKVADMDRFARHIEEFRYHVQDAMYREGAMRVTGQPHGFFFLAVSESIDCGRYPVRVFELDAPDVDAGHALFRRDLNTYHECRINDEWGGVEIIKRPDWARKQDMYV